jgi:hypothetical protein
MKNLQKKMINLKTACELKGINKKTAQNKPWLQPNLGKRERVGSKLVWHREDILEWLGKTDQELEGVTKTVTTKQGKVGNHGELKTA